ncbi:MAG: hypothetical protein A2Y74_04080 [Actinobacteria bacterium RBG_13_63_9]|nr:MAG: hypothetical protein A2Y74_04080 [Actinobacteria bacterium RBG_13_63_9]
MFASVLGLAGLAVSVFSLFNNLGQQQRQNKIDLNASLAENKVQIQQTEAQVQGYEQFLSAMPVAGQAIQGSTGNLEFDTNYRSMLENFGNTNVLAGMRGQVAAGTSASAVSGQAQGIMTSYVDIEKKKAEKQLEIYKTTMETLVETKDLLGEYNIRDPWLEEYQARKKARLGK